MAEGHTIHALARRFNVAFAGTTPRISSPQGAIEIVEPPDGHRLDEADSWGKHLHVRFDGAPTLRCHLGMFRRLSVRQHRRAVRDGWLRTEAPVVGSVMGLDCHRTSPRQRTSTRAYAWASPSFGGE